MTALLVRGLSHSYGATPVLRDVSLAVQPGEVVAVIGPSGAGKSTLFRCLTRLVRPDAGAVEVFGRDLVQAEGRSLREARRELGLVFQSYNLVRRQSALDNVLVGRLAEVATWRVLARRFPRAEIERAASCLDQVGLLQHAHTRADRLSGGQQQRVAIARVLASRARIVLADEPVASLDPASAATVLDALRTLARVHGKAVLCSLHQVDLVEGFADRVVGLRDGAVAFDVPVSRFDAAAAAALYARPVAAVAAGPAVPAVPERTP